ncbi:alpha/beta hydrolase family protein [Rhizobium tumorigenes]|uniref:Prolyl oligopeptidase family serine peptidase n=1 Tax=Rhizobium tumorigenes TaxID=2041385 RepID=A0AAF1KTE9_9HYPH|nr:prolyl oligopeptidase family serine peptidase [Rhizobium tumorigenes]WFR97120.1 prolyl oligopeptidase family serine peptidase [Rhizobium tumorigenes]
MLSPLKTIAMLCTATVLTMPAQQRAPASETVGVREISAPSPERGTDLDVTVWYPALPGGKSMLLGESMFFVGTPAMLGAPISEGAFPLVLLSHGAGIAGNAQALSWLAAPLASEGFIVAAPNHPGNSGAGRSAAETMKLWLRPGDISDTLDAIGKDAFFKEHLESGKTGALGLSAGGSTALALAGARIDPQRLASYCDTDALNPSLCDWVRQSGVDLHAMDMQSAGRHSEDKRIRFAMAIDPAPVDVFEPGTFAEISIPVEIVNLGRPGTIPATADAAAVAKAIVDSRYSTIPDASHFSMFAECKPGAEETATAKEIGDPICRDGGGRSRGAIHRQLIDIVTAAFERELGSDR